MSERKMTFKLSETKLVEERVSRHREKFTVEIDLGDKKDREIRKIIDDLRNMPWIFTDDLANIIENE